MSLERETTSNDAQFLGSLALGAATGLLMADRFSRRSREMVSLAFLTLGLVVTVPFLTKYVQRRLHGPQTSVGAQRRLNAIRGAVDEEVVVVESEVRRRT